MLGALFALAACATPEARLRDGLVKAGLSRPMSACMARDMTPRLSIEQLRKLSALSKADRLDPATTSIGRYLHHVRALGDPGIWLIASKAAARCAID